MIDILAVYLDFIDDRLLEYLGQDDKVHGPCFPRKATGVVHLLSRQGSVRP